MKQKIVIIGGGAAGPKITAKLLRTKDFDCSIDLYTQENIISYSACGLPYYIEGLISNSETVANVDNLWIETTSAKTGAVINGEKIKLPDNVWLKNAGSNPNARVEIYDGKSVSMKNVYSLEGKTMIQVNGESSASVENIFISSNSIMNLQTNSSEGSKYDTGVIAIDHIDLGENSSIRASVYGDAANYEKTQPYLQLIGRDVTINLSKGAFVVVIFDVSIVILCASFHVILAPNCSNIVHDIFISLIFGRFSIVQTPSIKSVAGKIATAAFFAPLMVTSPFKGVGPFTTNFSNLYTPNIY